jgi:putative SOS response-associated peptidase YedK
MCGRFTRNYTWQEIHAMYSLVPSTAIPNLQPRFNVCPTTIIDAITPYFANRKLEQMRWGLIPAWWSKSLKEMRLATFNARAESIAEKPMFRTAFKKSRCLIPVSGYYEWQDTPQGKQPHYFTRRDGAVMTIAGIFDEWTDPETKQAIRSCAMVITTPNKLVAEIHDRMPVILERADFQQWERGHVNEAAPLMKPAADDVLQRWPVSKRVNSSRADDGDSTLIEPIN